MRRELLIQQVEAFEAQLIELNGALLALSSGTQESYRIDTGQTVTQVTQKDIPSLQKSQTFLMGQLCVLEARLNKGSTFRVIPTF